MNQEQIRAELEKLHGYVYQKIIKPGGTLLFGLFDLNDVGGTADYTEGKVLRADGDSYNASALNHSDLSLDDGTNPHSTTYSDVGAIQNASDTVKNTHIDWGTGTNQVSADNIPVEDLGDLYESDEVESVLSEVGTQLLYKADKPIVIMGGNFAGLDSTGNLIDSGCKNADYAQVSHTHDDIYYTETELATSGQAAVHWDNITDVPSGSLEAHHTTHENGGSDEISVAGLSGELADPQIPKIHASTHATGESDALSPTDIGAAAADHNHDGVYDSAGTASGLVSTHESTYNHSYYNDAYSHKTTEDAINGLVKCDGAGGYSAVTDGSSNWDSAYSHSQATSGNPHSVSASDVGAGTAQWNADKIKGVTVDDTAKSDGRVLVYRTTSGNLEYEDQSGSGSGTDEKVKIDSASTSGYIGAADNDGVLRADSTLTYTDGGDYITLGVADLYVKNSGGDAMEAKLTISDSATTAPLNITERSAEPSSPSGGDIYLDDGTNTLSGAPAFRRYTGSAWESISDTTSGGNSGVDTQNLSILATHTVSGDYLNEDCGSGDLSSWTEANNGGDVTETTEDSRDCFKFESPAGSGKYASAYIDPGSLGANYSLEITLKFETVGTIGNNDYFKIQTDNGSQKIDFYFASTGVFLYDGTKNYPVDIPPVLDTWHTYRINVMGSTSPVICLEKIIDGEYVQVGYGNHANLASSADGRITLTLYSSNNAGAVYVDSVKIDDESMDMVKIDYDYLQIGEYPLTSGDITIDMDNAAGANSIDTGSLSASTWYSIWVIYNPTTETAAGLISLSGADPTLPSGYTKKRKVGWVRTSPEGDFTPAPCNFQFKQQARLTGSTWDFSTSSGTLWANSVWQLLDISSLVPPDTRRVGLMMKLYHTSLGKAFFIRSPLSTITFGEGYLTNSAAGVTAYGIANSGVSQQYLTYNISSSTSLAELFITNYEV